jgi:hypothetical protein
LPSMPAARVPGRGARQRFAEAAHGQACAAVYEPSMRFTTSTMRPYDGVVANRDAFQQHRQLRRRQIDLASISLWPNKSSARKPLRKKP